MEEPEPLLIGTGDRWISVARDGHDIVDMYAHFNCRGCNKAWVGRIQDSWLCPTKTCTTEKACVWQVWPVSRDTEHLINVEFVMCKLDY